MSHPYKRTSVGLLFLLIQAALVALLMIAAAVGLGTNNQLLMGLLRSSMLLWASAILLMGLVGKLMCLISNTRPRGRIVLALSLMGDVGCLAIPLLNFLDAYSEILSILPTLLLAIYLILLARELQRHDVAKIVISSIGCFVVSALSFYVMTAYRTDMTLIVGGIVGIATGVYGTMLDLRALAFLRRAIATWPPASDVANNPDSPPAVPE